MSAHAVGGRSTHRAAAARTAASAWHAIAGAPITDELLEWPPDLFALANTILAQTEAFRFCLSPVREWPPSRYPDWAREVEEAGREWGTWVEDRRRAIPRPLAEEWSAFCERADAPLDDGLTEGRDWRMCEALLTLHAIADEACAGLGVALDSSHAEGCVYRARGRELLVRTGSLARISPTVLRVLPKRCARRRQEKRRSHATRACRARAWRRAGIRCPPAIAARIPVRTREDAAAAMAA